MDRFTRSPAWVQPKVPPILANLFKHGKTIKLKKRTVLANLKDELYYLESGLCWQTFFPIENYTATASLILPGRTMGEISALHKKTLFFNFETLMDSVFKTIPKSLYFEKLKQHNDFTVEMLHYIVEKESSYIEGMLYNSILQAEDRLVILLANIARESCAEISNGYTKLPYRFSQDTLADIIHTSRTTVNKIMQDWFNAGVIKKERHLYLADKFFEKIPVRHFSDEYFKKFKPDS